MAKKRRPCPRGLYNGCPIPRELCTEDHARAGEWHCLKFIEEFEWFVFGSDSNDPKSDDSGMEEIVSLEDLMRVLEGMDGKM